MIYYKTACCKVFETFQVIWDYVYFCIVQLNFLFVLRGYSSKLF